MPDALIERMRASRCHEVVTPEPLRVQLLREEYAHLIADPERLFGKLDCLKELHSRERIENWKALASGALWDEFVSDMLVHHYDPAYSRSMFRNYILAQSAQVLPVSDISGDGFRALARMLTA